MMEQSRRIRSMKKRNLALVSILVVLAMAFMTACGSSSGTSSSSYEMKYTGGDGMYDNGYYYDEEWYSEPAAAAADSSDVRTSTQDIAKEYGLKIIYTANLQIESTEYEECQKNILNKVREVGGYIENSNEDNYSSRRNLDLTVRIPVDKYDEFINSISGYGNLRSKSESSNDVTSQYMDVEARLKSLQTQRDRLEELALKAEDIETLLAIESQIAEVQYQIESYTSQRNFYDNKVSFATVYVYLQEVKVVTPTQDTFWSRLQNAFSGSWRELGQFLEGAPFFLIYAIPYIIIIAIITIIVVKIAKKSKAKRLEKARLAYEQRNVPPLQNPVPAPENKAEETKQSE